MENSAALATQLADYDSKRKNSVDVLNEAMGKYGVPEIRSRVSGLRTTLSNTESALNSVDPSVTGRTSGSLVTEAQRTKQVANERAPIAEQYGQQSRALGDATGNLSDQERAAQLLAQTQLHDYETGRTALSGRYQLATDREAEQRRREEADRDYRLRAASATSGHTSGYTIGSGSGGTKPAPAATDTTTDATTQTAYNDVKNLLGKDGARIQREYLAIKQSAGFGNAYDKIKLGLIEQMYPAAKNFGNNTVALGSSSPTLVSLNPTPSTGLSVTTATPQRLVVR